jgi:hypothetical protein
MMLLLPWLAPTALGGLYWGEVSSPITGAVQVLGF